MVMILKETKGETRSQKSWSPNALDQYKWQKEKGKGLVASMYNCYIFDPTIENLRTRT